MESLDYGTLSESTTSLPEKRFNFNRSKAVVVFVALAIVACFTFSGLSPRNVNKAVDANKNKKDLTPIPGVCDLANEVIDNDKLRFAIFMFDRDNRESMVPAITGEASQDWKADWKSFNAALPTDDVAMAVYNFPVWKDDETFFEVPSVITWAPKDAPMVEFARGGYFLGTVMLCVEDRAQHTVSLSSAGQSYSEFCNTLEMTTKKECSLERNFHNCPFTYEGALNPCNKEVCDGASFSSMEDAGPGVIPADCCDYIDDFCSNGATSQSGGCHPVTRIAMDQLCENYEDVPSTPDILLPPEELMQCTDDCIQPCAFFDSKEETYEKCAGCPTKHELQDNGAVYKCHAHAYGFMHQRCCGVDDVCSSADARSETGCKVFEETHNCKWVEHLKCSSIKEEQQAAIDEAIAAKAAEEADEEAVEDLENELAVIGAAEANGEDLSDLVVPEVTEVTEAPEDESEYTTESPAE